MKSVKVKVLMSILILVLALPALCSAAPAAKKKAKDKDVPKEVSAPAKPDPTAGLDKRWLKENQELLQLIQDKKPKEAQQKAGSTISYLTEKKLLGGQEAATTYNNLGMVQISQGQYDDGVTNIVKALELKRKIHGDASLEVAAIWQNLSEIYKVQAQAIRDKKIQEEIQKAQTKLDGLKEGDKQGPEAAAAHYTLGTLFVARGQFDAAQSHLLSALNLYKKLSGEQSTEVSNVSLQLAELYRLQAQIVFQNNQRAGQKAAAAEKKK